MLSTRDAGGERQLGRGDAAAARARVAGALRLAARGLTASLGGTRQPNDRSDHDYLLETIGT